jgi:hypothetical protein
VEIRHRGDATRRRSQRDVVRQVTQPELDQTRAG